MQHRLSLTRHDLCDALDAVMEKKQRLETPTKKGRRITAEAQAKAARLERVGIRLAEAISAMRPEGYTVSGSGHAEIDDWVEIE